MHRARRSRLPTLGSKDILITRACSLTPLGGHKIMAILTRGFDSKVITIYWCGADTLVNPQICRRSE
jgi:hypothetical protein